MPGQLIILDGGNGCGKTEQLGLLLAKIQQEQISVRSESFPRYGQKSAGPVEDYLAGIYGDIHQVGPKRGSLFYAIDRYAASFAMKRDLAAGTNIICARYVSSNMGYQGAKIINAQERRELYKWLYDLEYGLFELPPPNLVLLLHLPAEIAQQLILSRGAADAHEVNLDFLKRAEETYYEIAELYPNKFTVIECAPAGILLSRQVIHEKIWNLVKEKITAKIQV